jgi:hypothetical protein
MTVAVSPSIRADADADVAAVQRRARAAGTVDLGVALADATGGIGSGLIAVTTGVRPVLERMPLEQANEALARLRAGAPRFRIVLDPAARS